MTCCLIWDHLLYCYICKILMFKICFMDNRIEVYLGKFWNLSVWDRKKQKNNQNGLMGKLVRMKVCSTPNMSYILLYLCTGDFNIIFSKFIDYKHKRQVTKQNNVDAWVLWPGRNGALVLMTKGFLYFSKFRFVIWWTFQG